MTVRKWVANDGSYPGCEEGSGWFPSTKVRLFRNDPRIRFVNVVHEGVDPSLWKHGLKIDECPVPVHHYGRILAEKGPEKGDIYYAAGKEKLRRNPGDQKAMLELAIQSIELGKHDEAKELLEKISSLSGSNTRAEVHFNLSTVYSALGRHEDALHAASSAIKMDPALKEAYINYSSGEVLAGDVLRAIPVLEELCEREPGYYPALGYLAVLYSLGSQKEKGTSLFSEINRKGFSIADFVADVTEKLIAVDRISGAAELLSSAAEAGCESQRIRSLTLQTKDAIAYAH
jgi:tetratricopeptide (TPR) repeat protein